MATTIILIDMCHCEACGMWFFFDDVDLQIHAIRDYVDMAQAKRARVTVEVSVAEFQAAAGQLCSGECFGETEVER